MNNKSNELGNESRIRYTQIVTAPSQLSVTRLPLNTQNIFIFNTRVAVTCRLIWILVQYLQNGKDAWESHIGCCCIQKCQGNYGHGVTSPWVQWFRRLSRAKRRLQHWPATSASLQEPEPSSWCREFTCNTNNSQQTSPNIIRVIESRRMTRAGHVARMWDEKCIQYFG